MYLANLHLSRVELRCKLQGNCTVRQSLKGTVSPPERCDLEVHELFQVRRICIKGVTFYNMPQYVLLYDQRLCNYH